MAGNMDVRIHQYETGDVVLIDGAATDLSTVIMAGASRHRWREERKTWDSWSWKRKFPREDRVRL